MALLSSDSPFKALEGGFFDAVDVVQHRRMMDSPLKRTMADVADRYNGDFTIPLPDVEDEPEFPALSAAIIADAIDSNATRANDTLPGLFAPPMDPSAENHRARAHLRRRAWGAAWADSQLELRLGRAYRQLFGYGTFCLMVIPDHQHQCSKIITRDALTAYPEAMGQDEVRTPGNIGFVYGRSPSELMRQYPESTALIRRHTSTDDDLWDVLEWVDNDMIYVGIMGKRNPQIWGRRYLPDGGYAYSLDQGDNQFETAMLLRAYPNRAGVVPVACPSMVTLDRVVSSLKRIIPITDLLNKVAALDYIASERGVFPDRYAVGAPNGSPKVVGGAWHDGRTGKMNLLEDVASVGELNTGPGPMTQQLLSMLERNARVSSGNPSLMQGELSGSVRSGQTISQLGSFAVDPRIKEAHLLMGYALRVVNEGVAAVQCGYWPGKKYTIFSGWAGDNAHVSYVPRDIWTETRESVVQYPMPGMDVNNATIALAQANGSKMMSRKTARTMHPLINDADVEEQNLVSETLEDAIQMAALQMVGSGSIPFTDLVAIKALVDKGKSMAEAIDEVQRKAQERQATQAPPPPEGMAASPEAQPGINQPGAGGEQMPTNEGIAAQGGKMAAFTTLLNAIRHPPPSGASRPAGAEQGPPVR